MLRAAQGSLARQAVGFERLTVALLAVSGVLLAFGVTLPVVRVSKLFVLSDHHSIVDGITVLFTGGDVFLAGVVLAFSIVFPTLKILSAGYVWRRWPAGHPRVARALDVLGWVGRWSMLDVLVVALIVFSVKASAVADASTEPGLYCFAGAVATSTLAVALLKRTAARVGAQAVDKPCPMH